jgi:hypothetical protein
VVSRGVDVSDREPEIRGSRRERRGESELAREGGASGECRGVPRRYNPSPSPIGRDVIVSREVRGEEGSGFVMVKSI